MVAKLLLLFWQEMLCGGNGSKARNQYLTKANDAINLANNTTQNILEAVPTIIVHSESSSLTQREEASFESV